MIICLENVVTPKIGKKKTLQFEHTIASYDIKNLSLFGFYVLNISRDWCLGHGTKIYEFPGTGNTNEKLLYYCLTNMLSKFCKKKCPVIIMPSP